MLRVSRNTTVRSSKLYDSFSDPCITHFGIVGAQYESFVGVIRAASGAKNSEYQRVSQNRITKTGRFYPVLGDHIYTPPLIERCVFQPDTRSQTDANLKVITSSTQIGCNISVPHCSEYFFLNFVSITAFEIGAIQNPSKLTSLLLKC